MRAPWRQRWSRLAFTHFENTGEPCRSWRSLRSLILILIFHFRLNWQWKDRSLVALDSSNTTPTAHTVGLCRSWRSLRSLILILIFHFRLNWQWKDRSLVALDSSNTTPTAHTVGLCRSWRSLRSLILILILILIFRLNRQWKDRSLVALDSSYTELLRNAYTTPTQLQQRPAGACALSAMSTGVLRRCPTRGLPALRSVQSIAGCPGRYGAWNLPGQRPGH